MNRNDKRRLSETKQNIKREENIIRRRKKRVQNGDVISNHLHSTECLTISLRMKNLKRQCYSSSDECRGHY